jgi:hypothetical protein
MNNILRKTLVFIVGAVSVAIFVSIANQRAANVRIAAEVDTLVASATRDARAEKEAFAALEAIGDVAVPFIVGHLGDMRRLPDPQISFPTSNPRVNEAVAHYEAEVVHDALSIILQNITHQDIGSYYDSSNVEERNVERKKIQMQWVEFCQKQYQKNAQYCLPGAQRVAIKPQRNY